MIPLGLTAAATTTDAAVHKKMFRSGHPLDLASRTTTLIISNDEMDDVVKIVKSLEESGSLKKVLVKQLKMKQKNKKEDFPVCY